MLKQPRAVWAVAFACVIAFMGIGLVDPILKDIAAQLQATPSQVSLMFTSYMAIMGFAMLITGVVSSRIGPKRTLLAGLTLIIVFAALAGSSDTVGQIVGFRAGWGLGNALFVATALATIVSASSGSTAQAIILFEAALGIGIASGPLVGGLLGEQSWRAPFFGVSCLMVIALVATSIFLPKTPPTGRRTSLMDPFRALRYPALLLTGLTAIFYNIGFFTILAAGPFALPEATILQIGWIFFGWGLLLAFTSVFVAPVVQRWFGSVPSVILMLVLFAADLAMIALFTSTTAVVITGIVLSGAFIGINNTLITEIVMGSCPGRATGGLRGVLVPPVRRRRRGPLRGAQARRERQPARALLVRHLCRPGRRRDPGRRTSGGVRGLRPRGTQPRGGRGRARRGRCLTASGSMVSLAAAASSTPNAGSSGRRRGPAPRARPRRGRPARCSSPQPRPPARG